MKKQRTSLPAPDVPSDSLPLVVEPPRSTSVLTSTMVSSMENYVSRGLSFRQAALASGASESAYEDWSRLGNEGKQPYAVVLARLRTAHAVWQEQRATRIMKAGEQDELWKANAWLLEHNRESRAEWAEAKDTGPAVVVQIGVAQGLFTKG